MRGRRRSLRERVGSSETSSTLAKKRVILGKLDF